MLGRRLKTGSQRRRAVAAVLTLALGAPVAAGGPYWPQWGGPRGDFEVPDAGLVATWPESGPTVLWSKELGGGYSSVVRGVLSPYLFTMTRRGDLVEVLALEAATGATAWARTFPARTIEGQALDFGKGPNSTPLITASGVLVTVDFTGHVRAYRAADGRELWSLDLVADLGGKVHDFGYASSPVFHDGLVLLPVGGEKGIVGLDPTTGAVEWSSEPLDPSYATPVPITVDGEAQLAFMTATEVLGVDRTRGRVRWRHPHANQFSINCAGPWWGDDDLLFVSSQGDSGSRTLRLGRTADGFVAEQVARNTKLSLFHSSALRRGDWVYGASGRYLVAYDLRNDRIAWQESGFPEANLVGVGDRAIALGEDGELSLLTLRPDGLTVHARHQLLGKPSWTPPTLTGLVLYARDQERLVALDLRAPPATRPATAPVTTRPVTTPAR